MTKGGTTKLKPEAIGSLVEHLVRAGPIRRADMHRFLRERRAFRPLKSAVQHPECAQGTDDVPGDAKRPDRSDHGLPQDLARLLDLFRASLRNYPSDIKPGQLRDRLYQLAIFERLVDELDDGTEPAFRSRLGLKLAEHLLDT